MYVAPIYSYLHTVYVILFEVKASLFEQECLKVTLLIKKSLQTYLQLQELEIVADNTES